MPDSAAGRRGPNADLEKARKELSDNLLVQAKLVARFERATEKRLANLENQVQSQAEQRQEFRVTTIRVLELLERFVAGQGGGDGEGA